MAGVGTKIGLTASGTTDGGSTGLLTTWMEQGSGDNDIGEKAGIENRSVATGERDIASLASVKAGAKLGPSETLEQYTSVDPGVAGTAKAGEALSEGSELQRWESILTVLRAEDYWAAELAEAESEASRGPNVAGVGQSTGRCISAAAATHEKQGVTDESTMHHVTDDDKTWYWTLSSRKRSRRLGSGSERQGNGAEQRADEEEGAVSAVEKKRTSLKSSVLEEKKSELNDADRRFRFVEKNKRNILSSGSDSKRDTGSSANSSSIIITTSSVGRDGKRRRASAVVGDENGGDSGYGKSRFFNKRIVDSCELAIRSRLDGNGYSRGSTYFSPRRAMSSVRRGGMTSGRIKRCRKSSSRLFQSSSNIASRGYDDLNSVSSRCQSGDISITQSRGGGEGIPQFIVQIINNTCMAGCVHGLHVHCGWFASADTINPRIFSRLTYDDSIVNAGEPLPHGAILSFTYSNSFMYPLSLKSARFHSCRLC